jgi:type IV pilus assembly protein PilW
VTLQTNMQTGHMQRGFSLVELMVAMTMSLLLLAGALSILYSSRLSYEENDKLARLQEAGRTAMELLLRDVRGAGYQGCSRPIQAGDFINAISGGATSLLWDFERPLMGYNAAGGVWAPTLDAAGAGLVPAPSTGSDVLVLRTARDDQPSFHTVGDMDPSTAAAPVEGPLGVTVTAGTPMVIADCRGATAFFVSADFTTNATTGLAEIPHEAGAVAGTPGNAEDSLVRGFFGNSTVTPVQTVVYYVAPNAGGVALWQKTGSAAPVALIDGVERIQFRYGVDTNLDMVADSYIPAAAGINWNNVVSLEVAILVRAEDEYGQQENNITYTLFPGETFTPPAGDRHRRSVFATTIVLRNRSS